MILFLFLLIAGISAVTAQFTHPGCANLTPSDFRAVELIKRASLNANVAVDASLTEPLQIDFDPIMAGDSITHVDVYFIERGGGIKRYNAQTNQVSEIGRLTVRTAGDDYGLKGLALHPGFKTNRWMFLQYTPYDPQHNGQEIGNRSSTIRISRFTVGSNGNVDMGSEKVLIEFDGGLHWWTHHGGPMVFDRHGDLWIASGNDSPDHNHGSTGSHVGNDPVYSDLWGAGNTANLRGSILRIHPDNSSPGYSVPAGNFGEYWANQFQSSGNAALAAEYRDPQKVLPEIYSKGHRSNYSLAAHPTKDWIAWGEVNPSNTYDEFNLASNPVFAGYPFYYGNQVRTDGHTQPAAAPRNTSSLNSGVADLPPAVPGTINGLAQVAIAGPIYVYDSTLKSDVKFPPHLDEHWFTFDFTTQSMWAHTLDLNRSNPIVSTQRVSGSGNLMSAVTLINPLDAHFGPEGALYILNYAGWFNSTNNTGITRVEYTSNCLPSAQNTGVTLQHNKKGVQFFLWGARVSDEGPHSLRVYSLSGELIQGWRVEGPREYNLTQLLKKKNLPLGVYWVRFKPDDGAYQVRPFLLK